MSRMIAAFVVAALTLAAQPLLAAETGTPGGDDAKAAAVKDVSLRTALVVAGAAGVIAVAIAADDDDSTTATTTTTSSSATSTH